MATLNKDGSIQLTMEEFKQMQADRGNAPDNANANNGGQQDSGSWMDKWKAKMTPKKKEGGGNPNPNPQNNQQKTPQGLEGLTRESLMEASKKLNFFEPTPEQMAKIQAGDMSGLMEAQQAAFQRLFVDATMTSKTLVEGNSTQSKAEFQRMIQDQIGGLESAKAIKEKTGDFFNAPGGDLMVSALTRQFREANPDAQAGEIGDMVQGYLKDFSANFGQKETTPNAREASIAEAQKSATDF